MPLKDTKTMKFVCGSSHKKLGDEIANYLGIECAQIKCSKFSCGELYACMNESVRGMDVFLLQTGGPNVNEDIMELFIIVDSLKRASAKSINVIIPHYPYARQDKKSAPREPVSAKLVADLLETSGIDRIITMDLHADQIQGYFNVPVDHLTALPLFVRYFKNLEIKDLVVVAPDTGRAKAAKKLADKIGAELAIMHKTRPEHNVAEIMHLVGDVKNKTVLLFDDMVDTAGSITQGLAALKQHGANPDIYLATTHPVFSGPAIDRLVKAGFKEVVVTNTIPLPEEKRFDGLRVLTTAPLLAEAVLRNHTNTSISELFEI